MITNKRDFHGSNIGRLNIILLVLMKELLITQLLFFFPSGVVI
jgi:hypothetical protein